MNQLAEMALWLALAGAAWSAGMHLARWDRLPDTGPAGAGRLDAATGIPVATAALLVVVWGVLAGALLRGDAALALTLEDAPVAAGWYHVGALWGSVRGGLLTLAMLLGLAAVPAAMASDGAGTLHASRLIGTLSAVVVLLLATSVLLLPPLAPAAGARAPASVPLFLVRASALVAPLMALGAVAATLAMAALLIARGADGKGAVAVFRRVALAAWMLATLAIAAEQAARVRLGIGVEDAVVLGSSRSGLALWLALGVLVHGRLRDWLLGTARAPHPLRWTAHAAHAGAALVVLSFALHIGARRTAPTLPPGSPVEVKDTFGRTWTLVNQGLSRYDADARDITALAVEVTAPSGASRLLTTEQHQYFDRTGQPLGNPLGLRAAWRGPLQDLRLVLDTTLAGDVAHVRVSFVPLAVLWTAGIVLMLVGGGAALVTRASREPDDTGGALHGDSMA